MNVIWKRPDGFHGASPADYQVITLESSCKIWLHRSDNENYPFRISGGWQDEAATRKLNNLINLINKPIACWQQHLQTSYSNSNHENYELFHNELTGWLDDINNHLKGDRWEVTIMKETLQSVSTKINSVVNKT